MAKPNFEARVRLRAGQPVIDLLGEINAFASGDLSAAYHEAETQSPGDVLLNFDKVDYINSTGIALIVGLLAKARQSGRRLKVCGLSEHYMEIFQITRLIDFMRVYPDEVSALKSV